MTGISSLYTALSGMRAQSKVLDLTGHNVANAATPGYHRQRAELQAVGNSTPGLFAGTGVRGYGVNVIGTTQSLDVLYEARAVREEGARSQMALASSTLAQLQSAMPEPTENGLGAQLDEFWGAWSDVANQPDSAGVRTQLLAKANSLTASLHSTAAQITAIRDASMSQVAALGNDATGLAAQIATLNRAILVDPDHSLDLKDQRGVLLTNLAKLTGAVARPAESGQIDVYIGGRTIVSGANSFALDGTTGTLRWASDGATVSAPSGDAAALAATITDIVPRYTAALDAVASQLVTSVNALHTTGYDQAGATGHQFFDGTKLTAATITLSTDVAGQPSKIAAGAPVLPGPVAPGPLDGEQARAIALLAGSATGADSQYHSLITNLAVETSVAFQRAELQDQVADSAKQQADSVGAVSVDEEMANLTAAQRGYEASARVLTAVDDMLAFLIEHTGVVGR